MKRKTKRYGKVKTSSTRRSPFTAKRRSKRSKGSSTDKPLELAAYAFGYGAVRAPVAMAIDKWTSQLPLPAQLTDEAALGVAAYIGVKKAKKPWLKKLSKVALVYEAARIGDTIASPMVTKAMGGFLGTGSANNNNSGLFVN